MKFVLFFHEFCTRPFMLFFPAVSGSWNLYYFFPSLMHLQIAVMQFVLTLKDYDIFTNIGFFLFWCILHLWLQALNFSLKKVQSLSLRFALFYFIFLTFVFHVLDHYFCPNEHISANAKVILLALIYFFPMS